MATGILDNIKEAVQASLNVSQMKTLTTPIIVDETEYSTVETALNAINSKSVDVDDELSAVSENPIQNKVITEEINKKLTVVDNMPTASAEFVGKQRLYVGESSASLNKGGIYECRSDGNDGYEWVLISTADVDLSKYKKIFTGTRAEWDALTTAEKGEYDICNLTDDLAGGELVVSDTVTEGDLNPVTSNAVFDAIQALSAISLAYRNYIIADANNIIETGIYVNVSENTPITGWNYIIQAIRVSTFIFQVAYKMQAGTDSPYVAIRKSPDGGVNWSAWSVITGN